LALELGADAAVEPTPEGLGERLVEANEGRLLDVVFEMAGGEVFDASYRALAPFGRIVVCGIASQQPNHPSTGSLLRHSRAVVGFWVYHCLERPGMLTDALSELFARAARGDLRAVVGHTYPLEQAAQAHIDLRERRTIGKLLLDPAACAVSCVSRSWPSPFPIGGSPSARSARCGTWATSRPARSRSRRSRRCSRDAT